ncbi:cytochrome c biogenesis protein CcdA [Ferruginibacter paludis]|uniref:protein-disulfide reductase DsbD family protein n=1 Tax=Ferruginibacter paludis TaxID=1310417 RepID=UPI0025B3CC55|nr:thioredoxin family protein [Ferruginibacter paludis]MDN3657779.1 cytochrome c biogenesis protein CcdA [Ferruginibacter paludis]
MIKHIVLSGLSFFILLAITAQDQQPVQFSFSKEEKGKGEFILHIAAKPSPGIKLFSIKKISAELPVNTAIQFDSTVQNYLADSIVEKGHMQTKNDAALNNAAIHFYTDSVEWLQKVKLNSGDSIRIKANINYYYEKGESVESADQTVSMQFEYKENTSDVKTAVVADEGFANKSWIILLMLGMGAGLLAFITPCVYALVPVTVSLFLKRSKTPLQGRKNVLFYAVSIILIYSAIGALASVVPKTFWNNLSTHWIFNLFLFLMFLVFGLSFLGAFDINLPSSWANRLDSKSNSNSYPGIFFMAFTLVVVSFSCTGNFVASILGLAGGKAGNLGPVSGMFGFGFGLAFPFIIFAFFPRLLTVLTKSGGWQNALKVTLGFVELAFALKFLSNVDVAKNLRILDREVFIVLWVVIFSLLGFYLLGKLTFKHDSELPKNDWGLQYIPIPRLMLAIASFAFSVYLIPGLWGAPLNAVSAFVPAMGTQDFILYNQTEKSALTIDNSQPASAALPPVKYVKRLSNYEPLAAKQNNLTIYYDYKEALAASKLLHKPVMIDFTGIQCVNCRKFEASIWPDKEVISKMKNDFVVVSLFSDYDDEELPDNEKFFSKVLNGQVVTVGDRNEDLQQQLIQASGQPNYVFVDSEGKLLVPGGYGYDPTKGAKEFAAHLDKVLGIYKKQL